MMNLWFGGRHRRTGFFFSKLVNVCTPSARIYILFMFLAGEVLFLGLGTAFAADADDEVLVRGYIARANERRAAGDDAGLREDLESVLRLDSHNLDARRALGQLAFRNGSALGALEHYRSVLEIDPGNGMVPHEIWTVMDSLHDDQAALNEFESLLKAYPKNDYVRFYAAKANVEVGHYSQAESLLISLIREQPDLIAAHNLLRRALFEQGADRSFVVYRALVQEVPNSAQARVALAFACKEREEPDFQCAIDHFREATILAPDDANLRLNLAEALADANRPNEATREFQRARLLAKRDQNLLLRIEFGLGRAYSAAGKFEAAIEPLDHAERLNIKIHTREEPSILLALGRAYFETGDYGAAQSYYQRFHAQFGGLSHPALFSEYIQMGKAYSHMGARAEALRTFERAEGVIRDESDPRKAIAQYYIGQLLYSDKRLDESRRRLRSAARGVEIAATDTLNSLDDEDRKEFDRVQFRAPVLLAEVTGALGATEEALGALDRAEPRAANDVDRSLVARARGRVLLWHGDAGAVSHSLELFDRAAALNPDDKVAQADKAQALVKLGRFEEARSAYVALYELLERERPALPSSALIRMIAEADVTEARMLLRTDPQKAREFLASADTRLSQIPDDPDKLRVGQEIQNVSAQQRKMELEAEARRKENFLWAALGIVGIVLVGIILYFTTYPYIKNYKLRNDLTTFEKQLRDFVRRVKGIPRKMVLGAFIEELKQNPNHPKLGSRVAGIMNGRKAPPGGDQIDNLGLGDLYAIIFVLQRDIFANFLNATNVDPESTLLYIKTCRNLMIHNRLDKVDQEILRDRLFEIRKVFA